VTVTVLYFAALREIAGRDEQRIDLPPGVVTVGALRTYLERAMPPLAGRLRSIRFAVNESFAEEEAKLREGDVVALIPPVAGG
jgi:molybdopterin converting factor subunit 1